MKHLAKLTTAAVLTASIFAGCGGAKPQTPPAGQAPAGQAPAAGKQVTITYARPKDPTQATVKHIEEFTKANPNIKINFIEMPAASGTVHDDFVTKLSAGDTSVDIFTLDIVWPPEFGAANWVLPLDEYFPAAEKEKFLAGPIQGTTYNGKLYAVPFWTDAGLFYYRKDILDAAGKQPPKTWAEVTSLSKDLVGKNGIEMGFVFQGDQYEGLVTNVLEFMRGNGGDVLQDSKVVVNSPNNIEAINIMKGLIDQGVSPKGVTTYKEADGLRPFLEGKALFLRSWPSVWASAQTDPSSKIKDKVGVVAVPMGPKGTAPSASLGGWNLAVNANIPADRKDAAITFIKWMTGDPGQRINALVGGKLPTLKALYQDPDVLKANPHWKDFYTVFVNAAPRPVHPAYPKISSAIQINVHKAITGVITADEAVKNMQDAIGAVIK